MKKLALLTIATFALGALVSSCEKCTVCTAQSIDGEHASEYCGNELDVRDFEDFFIDSLAGITETGYCERGPNN